jgi:glutathione synthase/RimK-type ligase-like ATP-grasp enzyme
MKIVAFVTSKDHPGFAKDDLALVDYLQSGGVGCVAVPWDGDTTRWNTFDLLLIRSCWNYHRFSSGFVYWLNTIRSMAIPVLNPVETILWNVNKNYLRELQEAGISVPPTAWIEQAVSAKQLSHIMKENQWQKAVVKPVISASSFSTSVVTLSSLLSEEDQQWDFDGGIMVQEFMNEIPDGGEISLIYFKGEFSHAVLKVAKEGEFRVQSEFGGTFTPYVADPVLIDQGTKVLQASGQMSWYARVDGFIRNKEFVLMELELIEPNLFFISKPDAAATLGKHIDDYLEMRMDLKGD